MTPRVGVGYDVHPFDAEAGPLVLGGVEIPDTPGLRGHSDADALCHAIADALLSAAGLPDLGTRFPASDPQWQGVSSLALLHDVVMAIAAATFRIGNVSAVIVAEVPPLAAHLPAMVHALTGVLAPAANPLAGPAPLVTVTAKRGEGLDAVGEGLGIAVHAVVLLTS
jgi:2-C-methyl-D-erythritol 2,4-cyclodiphosphate synthase